MTRLINNFKLRLLVNDQDEVIIQDMMIIDSVSWPENIGIRYEENEVKRLCKRFRLNKENALNGMRQLIVTCVDNDNNNTKYIINYRTL